MNSTHVDKIRIRLLAEKFTKSKNVQGSRVMVAVRKREKLDRRKWFYFRWKVGRCTSRWQSISSPFPRSRQRQNTSSFRLPLFSFLHFFFSSDNAITRLIRSARVSSRNLENLGSLSPPALLRCVLCKQFKICFIFFYSFIYLFYFFSPFSSSYLPISRVLSRIYFILSAFCLLSLCIFFFFHFLLIQFTLLGYNN